MFVEDPKILAELWPFILSSILAIIAFARVEFKTQSQEDKLREIKSANEKALAIMDAKYDALNSKMTESLSSIRESLVRIEAIMEIRGASQFGKQG